MRSSRSPPTRLAPQRKAAAVVFGGAAVETAAVQAGEPVAQRGGPGRLAFTGSSTLRPVVIGLAMIAAGGLAIIRRRELESG